MTKTKALAKRDARGIVQSLTVEDLIARAIDKGDIDTIERLFNMRIQIKQETARELFFSALAGFQAECPIIKKTKKVMERDRSGVRYAYAPLESIIKQVGPLLAKHNLSFTVKAAFELEAETHYLAATCEAHHTAGHSEQTTFKIPIQPSQFMNLAQSFGAASSYAKRYAFCNAFGILTSDEDTDGISPEDARKAKAQTLKQPQAKPTAKKAESTSAADRPQIEPATDTEAVSAQQTIKTLRNKMTTATLSLNDFKKRFPAFQDLDEPLSHIPPSALNLIVGWISDPQNK